MCMEALGDLAMKPKYEPEKHNGKPNTHVQRNVLAWVVATGIGAIIAVVLVFLADLYDPRGVSLLSRYVDKVVGLIGGAAGLSGSLVFLDGVLNGNLFKAIINSPIAAGLLSFSWVYALAWLWTYA